MLMRLFDFALFGLVPFLLGSLIVPDASAAEKTVAGTIQAEAPVDLPPSASLTVQIHEISISGAPGAVVAEQTVENAAALPIKFELVFDDSVIQPETRYVLQAHIVVDNEIWYTTDERSALDPFTDSVETVDVSKVGDTGETAN